MRKYHSINRRHNVRIFPDGAKEVLPVDQFPVHVSNVNPCGFPSNDIQVLRELSAKGGLNNNRFEAAASRLNAIREHDNSKKTIEQLWQDWRPSWFQSPTEVVQFEEWYLNKYPFKDSKITDTQEDVASSDTVETVKSDN